MFPYRQILFALIAPLLLGACLLTPGKFDSTLDIRADRSFTFTYKGEVIALDMAKEMAKGMPSTTEDTPDTENSGEDGGSGDASEAADNEAKMKAIAEALSKESGYNRPAMSATASS